MNNTSNYKSNLIFFALLFKNETDLKQVKESISRDYGKIIKESPVYEFNHSAYYSTEMGEPLYRQFIGIGASLSPPNYWTIKHWATELETHFTTNDKRTINIDPGIIHAHNAIFFSTKDFAHRLPIGHQIYAEVSLIYKKKKFHALDWTYPDMTKKEILDFFSDFRKCLL